MLLSHGFDHSVQFVLEDLFEGGLDFRMVLDDFAEFLFHELGKLFECSIGDELIKHVLKIIRKPFRVVLFMVFAFEKGFEFIGISSGSFGIHLVSFFVFYYKKVNKSFINML